MPRLYFSRVVALSPANSPLTHRQPTGNSPLTHRLREVETGNSAPFVQCNCIKDVGLNVDVFYFWFGSIFGRGVANLAVSHMTPRVTSSASQWQWPCGVMGAVKGMWRVIYGVIFTSHLESCARREAVFFPTITLLLLDLSGQTLPARVSEWHHREPRFGGTMLAPNFARIDAERLENEICSIRRGPLGRAAALEIAARHGSRCVLSSRLVIYAHGDDSRTRSISLATTLEPAKPCPSAWTKPSQPNLAILTAGRAPARTRARDLVSNRAVWRLPPPQPSRRAAAWCANCSVLVGRSSFLVLCAVKRAPSSAAHRCRVCGETRKRRSTRARPCDVHGASGLLTARGLRALLGGPRSAFGMSSVSPRSARVLPPSFTCLRRGRRSASSHTTRTRVASCREPP